MMSFAVQIRISVAAYLKEAGVMPDQAPPAAPKRSIWRNKPTCYESQMVGLRRYDSKREANRASQLDLEAKGGRVIAWWH